MIRKGMTALEAAKEWQREFSVFPAGMIETLMWNDPDSWQEVTAPSKDSAVTLRDGRTAIVNGYDENTDTYEITIDADGAKKSVPRDELELSFDGMLPMWNRLWQFKDPYDEAWLSGHIREASAIGFRIYHHEEWGYFIGIDGAGYDFFEKHWLPLYRAAGIAWHDPETEARA